ALPGPVRRPGPTRKDLPPAPGRSFPREPAGQPGKEEVHLFLLPALALRPARDSPFAGRPRLSRLGLVRLHGRLEDGLALHLFALRNPVAGALGILEDLLEKLPPLGHEPAPEVLETVIGTAAVDDVGHPPQVPAVGLAQAVLQVLVERNDLLWVQFP